MITGDACTFGVWACEAKRDEHTVQEPSSEDKISIQIRRRRVMERNLPLKECLNETRRRRCVTWNSAQVKAMTHVERNNALAIKDLTNIDTNPWDVGALSQLRHQEGIGVKIFHL